jgi:hypothetical protein
MSPPAFHKGLSSSPYCGTYDDLLRLALYPEGVKIICFADDAALVATGQTTCLLEIAMNDTHEKVAA